MKGSGFRTKVQIQQELIKLFRAAYREMFAPAGSHA